MQTPARHSLAGGSRPAAARQPPAAPSCVRHAAAQASRRLATHPAAAATDSHAAAAAAPLPVPAPPSANGDQASAAVPAAPPPPASAEAMLQLQAQLQAQMQAQMQQMLAMQQQYSTAMQQMQQQVMTLQEQLQQQQPAGSAATGPPPTQAATQAAAAQAQQQIWAAEALLAAAGVPAAAGTSAGAPPAAANNKKKKAQQQRKKKAAQRAKGAEQPAVPAAAAAATSGSAGAMREQLQQLQAMNASLAQVLQAKQQQPPEAQPAAADAPVLSVAEAMPPTAAAAEKEEQQQEEEEAAVPEASEQEPATPAEAVPEREPAVASEVPAAPQADDAPAAAASLEVVELESPATQEPAAAAEAAAAQAPAAGAAEAAAAQVPAAEAAAEAAPGAAAPAVEASAAAPVAAEAAPAGPDADAAREDAPPAVAEMAQPAATVPPAAPAAAAPAAPPARAGKQPAEAAARPKASSSSSSNAAPNKDPLLLRIEGIRSARELQQLFEWQQQRLRPHHLAALVARLPATNEGRRAVQELQAAAARDVAAAAAASAPVVAASQAVAAAADDGSSSSSISDSTAAVLAFADDLLKMLQLQLGQLHSTRLAALVQAAAALQLAPRPAWISSFLAASQPKLQHLDATQLAGLATAVAALAAASSTSSTSRPDAAAAGKQQQQAAATGPGVRLSGAWVTAWMASSKQQLLQLQGAIREAEQQAVQLQEEAAAAAAAADEAAQAPARRQTKPTATAAADAGPLVGRLALAAVKLGVMSQAPTAATGPETAAAAGNARSRPGPTQAESIEWVAAMAAAAATAAAAVTSGALDAAAAADILAAMTAQQQQQPGLLMQIDQGFQRQQEQQAVASAVGRSYVRSVVAAVAAAARGSMAGSSSEVLLACMQGLLAFGVQPDDAWMAELAAALSRRVARLSPAQCCAVVDGFSTWCCRRTQQQQQQELDAALQDLSTGLLQQLSRSPASYSAQQLCSAVTAIVLHLGFSASSTATQAPGLAAALQGLQTLLQQLSHDQVLAAVPLRQVLGLMQALAACHGFAGTSAAAAAAGAGPSTADAPTASGRLPLDAGFVAAVQRDGLQPRLADLTTSEFAGLANALASLRVPMDSELLDGVWQHVAEQQLDSLTGPDCVALLAAVGALRQKPRAQHLGPFLAAMGARLEGLSLQQLSTSLAAVAALQLTRLDTQGLRATAALSAPTPEDFTAQLLQHLTPLLPGPEGATAGQLSSVLQSLVALGCTNMDRAWLAAALDGAPAKLSTVVAAGRRGEAALVELLSALGQATAKVPASELRDALQLLLDEALGLVKAVLHHLDAAQIAAAMTALRQLELDPDDSLMNSYLARAAAAAAAGGASAADMAAALASIAAAGVVPPPAWFARYMAAVQAQLGTADSASLAAIIRAAAELAIAGRAVADDSSSSSSGGGGYDLSPGLVAALVDTAAARIGSSYMDAARILSSPDYKAPLTLQGLADCCWGLLKLGADPAAVQGLVSMLVSKSYDRLTNLSGQQLAGAAWAIACCNAPTAVAGSKKGSASGSSSKLPSKWLNQLATAAAGGVGTLSAGQLCDLIWALGGLFLSAEHYATSSTEAGGSNAAAAAGSSSAEPVQQLLRAVAGQLSAQQHPSADALRTLLLLLAKFDCPASGRLLTRFCDDTAATWQQQSDAALTDTAAALAMLVGRQASSSGVVSREWLAALAERMQARFASGMPPQLCSRCIWSLATLHFVPGAAWLHAFAAAALTPAAVAELRPGDLSDALWGVWTLEGLATTQQQQQGASDSGTLLTRELLQQLDTKLGKRVHQLSPPQVVRLLSLSQGAAAAVPGWRLPRGVGEQMSAVLSARASSIADVAGVLELAWAAASLELPLHGSAVDHVCRKVYANLDSMSAADMARAFWASSKLRYGWLPPQLEQFDRQSQHKLQDMAGADVALMLEAFKTYGYAPSPAWLQQFAGMPPASLARLRAPEVLQLAIKLADPAVGLPAANIAWLLDWAEALDAAALQALSGQQLFDLWALLAAATGSTARGSSSSSSRQPSAALLGLLCWAVGSHVADASGQQVYCLVKALADWQYRPPNADVLLAAAATRVADKLPVLDQVQLSDVLCGFARLGFSVGEPLQSKICGRIMQAAAAAAAASAPTDAANGMAGGASTPGSSRPSQAIRQQAAQTAEVLAAVLVSIPQPSAGLVPSLMQQLDGRLHTLQASTLLKLGQGLATARMACVQDAAAAEPDAGSGREGGSSSSSSSIPLAWGSQYRAALAGCLRGLSLPELAAACSSLQRMRLPADTATAEAVVSAMQPHLAAETTSSSSTVSGAMLAATAGYIADSGFRPTAQVMEGVEAALLDMLRAAGSSSSSTEVLMGGSSNGAYAAAPHQQATPSERLAPSELAQLLLVLHRWGRRPGGNLSAAAWAWARARLQDCGAPVLGALLLGLCSTCGRPSEAWLLDWAGTSAQCMQDGTASDVAAIAAALAQAGGAASCVGSNWWEPFSAAVLRCLPDMGAEELETVAASLYKLQHAPGRPWLDALLSELRERVPDSSQDTPAARALAYARMLKSAGVS